jgi:hypothetical protein
MIVYYVVSQDALCSIKPVMGRTISQQQLFHCYGQEDTEVKTATNEEVQVSNVRSALATDNERILVA